MTGTPSPSRRVPSEPGDFPESGPYSLPPLTHRLAARLIDLVIVTLPVVAIAIGFVEVDGGEVRIEDVPWWLLGVQVGVAVVRALHPQRHHDGAGPGVERPGGGAAELRRVEVQGETPATGGQAQRQGALGVLLLQQRLKGA